MLSKKKLDGIQDIINNEFLFEKYNDENENAMIDRISEYLEDTDYNVDDVSYDKHTTKIKLNNGECFYEIEL